MPYQFQSRIRYSETGEEKKLTLPGLVNYFQDCSTFQSEQLGNGIDQMAARGKAWVLAYWQIELNRMPMLGENVTTQTWAYGFKGFQGDRNYRMLDEQGNALACANSLWIYVDVKSGHPVRVEKDMVELYPLEPALDLEKTSRKIVILPGGTAQEPFKVCRHHLDTNHHVNNAQYINMAEEYLPKEWDLTRVRVEYKNQAVLGDLIHPVTVQTERCMTVVLKSSEEKIYAAIEFTGK